MSARNAEMVLGVPIDRKTLGAAVAGAMTSIDRGTPRTVFACANPHSLVVAQKDAAFMTALNEATLVVPDGVGLTLMGGLLQLSMGPRITGEDFFLGLMRALDQRGGKRVFFFGSSETVLGRIRYKMSRTFPNVTVCGAFSPPFYEWSAEENSAMVAAINRTIPDVLWVGMTAPKQEKWVAANCTQLDVSVIGSIGAVFDFFAETHPRAPQWMRKMGLEWLYRLSKEPRRMWERNLISTPIFMIMATRRHLLNRTRP